MNILELDEKVKKVKVIRGGQKKVVKKSDREGFGIDPHTGKEKKISAQDKLKMSKSQKKASIKRSSKNSASSLKRKKSLNKRTF